MSNKQERIAALLRKAGDKASTEAEAASAMQLAQKLAAMYGISIEDIKTDSDEAQDYLRRDIRSPFQTHLHPVDSLLCGTIGRFTCTKGLTSHFSETGKRGRYVVFFGHAADVELAAYIRQVCMNAMDASWRIHKSTLPYGADIFTAKRSFCTGFAHKMKERMEKYARRAQRGTGRDLIVMKNELLVRRFDEYCRAKSIAVGPAEQAQAGRHDAASAAAGAAAAQGVDLGRGVSTPRVNLIGKG